MRFLDWLCAKLNIPDDPAMYLRDHWPELKDEDRRVMEALITRYVQKSGFPPTAFKHAPYLCANWSKLSKQDQIDLVWQLDLVEMNLIHTTPSLVTKGLSRLCRWFREFNGLRRDRGYEKIMYSWDSLPEALQRHILAEVEKHPKGQQEEPTPLDETQARFSAWFDDKYTLWIKSGPRKRPAFAAWLGVRSTDVHAYLGGKALPGEYQAFKIAEHLSPDVYPLCGLEPPDETSATLMRHWPLLPYGLQQFLIVTLARAKVGQEGPTP